MDRSHCRKISPTCRYLAITVSPGNGLLGPMAQPNCRDINLVGQKSRCNEDAPRQFFGIFEYISAAVAEWYRYRNVACFVTSSSPVPLKTRRVGQRCTLNLSRAETSSRWCGGVVRRGGASSGVVQVVT
ncbi:uncharacterized protein TNCV_1032291 [Trichonephila clavipes]|nr:uncharacterized protein TNCV_1032291 [Trichonephila clavipes]